MGEDEPPAVNWGDLPQLCHRHRQAGNVALSFLCDLGGFCLCEMFSGELPATFGPGGAGSGRQSAAWRIWHIEEPLDYTSAVGGRDPN